MVQRNHLSESQIRQIEKRLEAWPDVSYARIAGEAGCSRDTVKRIAGKKGKSRHRPQRGRGGVRCPGCGGLVKKNTPCHKCLVTRLASQRRLRAFPAAVLREPKPTASIL